MTPEARWAWIAINVAMGVAMSLAHRGAPWSRLWLYTAAYGAGVWLAS